jgi:hypothetical protein
MNRKIAAISLTVSIALAAALIAKDKPQSK